MVRFVLVQPAEQGAMVHHTIEITVPTEATEGVLAELEALEGVVTLSVLHGASVKPPGDVVTVHALNRGVDAVLAVAAQARQRGPVSVSTAGLQSLLDQQAQRAIDDDVDEAPWEEFERILRHHGQLNLNFLALMGLGAAIAVAGLLSAPVPQALALAAAAIIAPAFEPVAKLAVGLVRGSWYAVRRALIAVASGYVVMALAGALAYLLLQGLGAASPKSLAASEGVKLVIDPTAADWLISAGGAIAGLVIVTAFRHAVLAGALIALALVPAAALVGAGLGAGQAVMALDALRRVGLDVLLVIVLGGVVVLLKQRLIHHNRRPLI
ncbi:MAG: DUF389 domain-containing protein [Actinobacteria bacterium]|nr:DUF389 domain-containing protein [Actinomycetota bacterium]